MVQPVQWEPKDPDETVNYELNWEGQGLASGDTIIASEWVDVTGVTVQLDSVSTNLKRTLVSLAGGVDKTVAYLLNRINTAFGEIGLEQPVLLPIIANVMPVPLVGYEKPTPGHLVALFPAFAAVPYLTVQAHLTDAEQGVDTSWTQPDYAPALMELAAHKMALLGLGSHSEASGYALAGLTRIRSGNFDASFSEGAVGRASGGGLDATPYGRAYKLRLVRNRGGPRIVNGTPVSVADLYL